jgi:hypothetical protein
MPWMWINNMVGVKVSKEDRIDIISKDAGRRKNDLISNKILRGYWQMEVQASGSMTYSSKNRDYVEGITMGNYGLGLIPGGREFYEEIKRGSYSYVESRYNLYDYAKGSPSNHLEPFSLTSLNPNNPNQVLILGGTVCTVGELKAIYEAAAAAATAAAIVCTIPCEKRPICVGPCVTTDLAGGACDLTICMNRGGVCVCGPVFWLLND